MLAPAPMFKRVLYVSVVRCCCLCKDRAEVVRIRSELPVAPTWARAASRPVQIDR